MRLPQFQAQDTQLNLLQTRWASVLEPFLSKAQNNSTIITQVSLAVGSNTINTGLNAPLIGWRIIRQRAKASIFDTQDSNTNPNNTLLLTSDAAVVIDLEVF